MNVQRATCDVQRLRIEIHGAVQGVGFRPFVYRLASELGLAGWVINDTQGVFIEVEGPGAAVRRFLARLPAEVPPRAIVQTIASEWLPPVGYDRFEIRHSEQSGAKTVLVLPDIATCPDCLAEVLDPANRRYRYPFTNCTNCGPRFTIIQALPYDRPSTTMRRFVMCPDCQREYEDPLDRRFHAQPNACSACGPRLTLYEGRRKREEGRRVADDGPQTTDGGQQTVDDASRDVRAVNGQRSAVSHQLSVVGNQSSVDGVPGSADGDVQPATCNLQPPAVATGDAALRAAAAALRAGQIVAVKGLGGFHLMADAGNDAAIRRLRESKPRRAKPFALMVRDLDQAHQLCEVPPAAEALLTSPEAPIVLLGKRLSVVSCQSSVDDVQRSTFDGRSSVGDVQPSTFNVQRSTLVSSEVAPGNPNLGIMLPYTPLHHLLLREVGRPVVATSGNLSDEPICIDETEAMQRLGHIADVFLVHDRPIARHMDDSVAWIVRGAPRLLRRARGYAPLPVTLKAEIPTILAVGAHLKNTVALSVGRQVFISQHIGDLETPEAMAAFERVIADFLRLYEAQPAAIAHDLHPDYASTRYTLERSNVQLAHVTTFVPVQHHHAHLAACLAENGVEGPALGVTWDGTGYGADGTIWGGEFLLGDAAGFERVAHLRPFRLPGGDAAVKEPRRVALALLWEAYGDAALEMDDLAPIRSLTGGERRLLAQMLTKGLNAPITTSAGRLFDGVAALIGLHQEVSFEGQAAMALEYAADAAETGAYPIELVAGSRLQVESSAPSTFNLQPSTLDWHPLLDAVLADLRRNVPAGIIAARFHNALVEAIAAVAQAIGQPQVTGQPQVALTGGCFQNRRLTECTADRLEGLGFEVLLHRQVPPNDGGISLGQVAVAAARLNDER